MNSCTLIEFIGIPYSGKTITMDELSRVLRSRGVAVSKIEEFRGDPLFYAQQKLTADVNLLRALNFMQSFIHAFRMERPSVVLVDRGLFDTCCWLEWLSQHTQVPSEYQIIVDALTETVSKFIIKNRVVWMDRDPLAAVRSHGDSVGQIVNFTNLASLRVVYEKLFNSNDFPATFHRIDSDSGSAQAIANQLASQLKLL